MHTGGLSQKEVVNGNSSSRPARKLPGVLVFNQLDETTSHYQVVSVVLTGTCLCSWALLVWASPSSTSHAASFCCKAFTACCATASAVSALAMRWVSCMKLCASEPKPAANCSMASEARLQQVGLLQPRCCCILTAPSTFCSDVSTCSEEQKGHYLSKLMMMPRPTIDAQHEEQVTL